MPYKCPDKQREYQRNWIAEKKKRPGREHYFREQKLKRNFGLTLADYNAMREAQDNGCAICQRQHKSTKRLCVDHCHDTGKIRGLLCGNCNSGIGLLGDNVASVKNALRYLEAVE